MTSRYKPNEPVCPIPLENLSLLLRSNDERVASLVQQLPSVQMAALAIYCSGRGHMRRLGLLVASQCSETALRQVAGAAGEALFERSRDRSTFDMDPGAPVKRKISLARAA